jgi:hypothetical protein
MLPQVAQVSKFCDCSYYGCSMFNKIRILDSVLATVMDMYRAGALPFYLHQFLPLQRELISILGSKFVMFYEIHCRVIAFHLVGCFRLLFTICSLDFLHLVSCFLLWDKFITLWWWWWLVQVGEERMLYLLSCAATFVPLPNYRLLQVAGHSFRIAASNTKQIPLPISTTRKSQHEHQTVLQQDDPMVVQNTSLETKMGTRLMVREPDDA